jgi:hypothetical protein
VCDRATQPSSTFSVYRSCLPVVASIGHQRVFWALSFFFSSIGLVGTIAVLNEFARNPVLRDGVLRATLAIAIPDFVLSLFFTVFYFQNLLRGSKATGAACEFFGVVTSCIVHATFCGPPIVAFSTYSMIRTACSGYTRDPKLSRRKNACLSVLPWLLGFGFAMAALNEGKLGDYRGLLCYNTRWDSFFTGGITVGVFATSTVVTIALYLAAAALIAKTNRKAGTNLDSSSDMYKRQKSRLNGAPRLLLLRGLLLVGTFFASWINFVFAILVRAPIEPSDAVAAAALCSRCSLRSHRRSPHMAGCPR